MHRAPPARRRLWAAATFAALATTSGASQADLGAELAQLRAAYEKQGIASEPLGTLFGYQGEPRRVALPARAAGDARCRSLLAMAERHVRFVLDWASAPPETPEAEAADGDPQARSRAVESRAGIAVVHDCGAKEPRREIQLVTRSPRGAIELLLLRHDGPLPPVGVLAPERAIIAPPAAEWFARPMRLEPLERRVERTERAAVLDGARTVVRIRTRSNEQGVGAVRMKLPEGCHRISVVGGQPEEPPSPADLDAELVGVAGPELLARDRSTAPDARLEACLGRVATADLRFHGAAALEPATVLDSYWPMPAAIDRQWPAEVRARMAWALWKAGVPSPAEAPTVVALGAQGATFLPVELERRACYVAALAPREGAAVALRLSVSVGDRVVASNASAPRQGVAVGWCQPDGVALARLQVEGRAPLLWWQLGVWQLGRGAP